MAAGGRWTAEMMRLVRKMNSFPRQRDSSRPPCLPLYVSGQRVGTVLPAVTPHLSGHSEVFAVSRGQRSGRVDLCPGLTSCRQRSEALAPVLESWREGGHFECLRGWRDEKYEVKPQFSDAPLLHMERSATCLLGVTTYGVHVNGFVRGREGSLSMWIGKRSRNKPTFPGMLDNLVAGGLASGMGVQETLLKECGEEASLSETIAATARPAGSVSYSYDHDGGIFPECQFVYDLELPQGLVPEAQDGEMEEFYLWPLEQVKEAIARPVFKPASALVTLDFLIRHGAVDADREPFLQQLMEGLHREPGAPRGAERSRDR